MGCRVGWMAVVCVGWLYGSWEVNVKANLFIVILVMENYILVKEKSGNCLISSLYEP